MSMWVVREFTFLLFRVLRDKLAVLMSIANLAYVASYGLCTFRTLARVNQENSTVLVIHFLISYYLHIAERMGNCSRPIDKMMVDARNSIVSHCCQGYLGESYPSTTFPRIRVCKSSEAHNIRQDQQYNTCDHHVI